MNERELRRRLLAVPAPHELDAQRRAWHIVRAAFAERAPVPRGRHLLRPALAAAAVIVLAAAIFNPPVLSAIRDAIGTKKSVVHVVRFKPALFSLPAPGRLLVDSGAGTWIVKADGQKRLLGAYHDASWSPHGLFLAGVRTHELVALEPGGAVRWTLTRSGRIASPRWSPVIAGSTRIAYLRDRTLRVVVGNGADDRLLAPAVAPVAPAWRPGRGFVVAYVAADSRIHVVEADTQKLVWQSQPLPAPVELDWSADGSLLLALSPHSVSIFHRDGTPAATTNLPGRSVAGAFAPSGHRFLVLRRVPSLDRSVVAVRDADDAGRPERLVLAKDGKFTDATWSPDGRWILVGWQSADLWMFVPLEGNIQAKADITRQFASGPRPSSAFPTVVPDGWCCRPSA
jgi:hypothetical protein